MNPTFRVNPHQMTDFSATVYGVDSPQGERIASTTDEGTAQRLCKLLNSTIEMWARETGSDAIVNADFA